MVVNDDSFPSGFLPPEPEPEAAPVRLRTRFETKPVRYAIYDRRSPVFDVAMVALAFGALLFNSWIGPLTPLIILAITPLFMLLRFERIYSVLTHAWPVLLLPLLAMASTVWSDEPTRSIRYGFLYFMTATGALFIGAGCDRRSILQGMMLAFGLYMALSFPFGRWAAWGVGGRAWIGLMASKNASGDASALTLIISLATLFWALGERRWVWVVLALAFIPLSLFSLYISKATGALAASLVALPCLFLWSLSRWIDPSWRNLIFVVSVMFVVALLATIQWWMPPLFEFVLEASGKDADLTGRSVLWAKADELIAERPWLGMGYEAFWVHHNLDAEYLWREMGIRSRRGFNFHNTPRDILVALGVAGLAIYAFTYLFSAAKLLLGTMRRPEFTGILFSTLLVFESPRVWFEMIGFSTMQFATFILFVIFAYGLRPRKTAPLGQPVRLNGQLLV